MPTVVIAEDEEDLRLAVVEYLGGRGLRVLAAPTAAAVRSIAAQEPIDVAVLDIRMPGEDGLSLARWLRAQGSPLGIIFATASSAPIERIVGLQSGADDYLVKPYDLRELLARIRSLLRRLPEAGAPIAARADAAPRAGTVRVGAFDLDLDRCRLCGPDGALIELTPMEADLLAVLATRPNRVLSREQLLALSHGPDRGSGESERSIDVRITRLRKKIEADPDQPSLIRTVRGEGYMFVPDPA